MLRNKKRKLSLVMGFLLYVCLLCGLNALLVIIKPKDEVDAFMCRVIPIYTVL